MELQIHKISFKNRYICVLKFHFFFNLNNILFNICIAYIYSTITLELHKRITYFFVSPTIHLELYI